MNVQLKPKGQKGKRDGLTGIVEESNSYVNQGHDCFKQWAEAYV